MNTNGCAAAPRVTATPRARHLADLLGLNLVTVGGHHLTADDLRAALPSRHRASAATPASHTSVASVDVDVTRLTAADVAVRAVRTLPALSVPTPPRSLRFVSWTPSGPREAYVEALPTLAEPELLVSLTTQESPLSTRHADVEIHDLHAVGLPEHVPASGHRPAVVVLTVGAATERVVPARGRDDELGFTVRRMSRLGLSYDAASIDVHQAGSYLLAVRDELRAAPR